MPEGLGRSTKAHGRDEFAENPSNKAYSVV